MNTERDWDFLKSISYLYVAFAGETDGELTEDEVHVIQRCIREWVPDATEEELVTAWQTACQWIAEDHKGNGDGKKVTMTMANIAALAKDIMDPKQRVALLQDLVRISVADSNFDEKEKEWVRFLAELMEVEFKV